MIQIYTLKFKGYALIIHNEDKRKNIISLVKTVKKKMRRYSSIFFMLS